MRVPHRGGAKGKRAGEGTAHILRHEGNGGLPWRHRRPAAVCPPRSPDDRGSPLSTFHTRARRRAAGSRRTRDAARARMALGGPARARRRLGGRFQETEGWVREGQAGGGCRAVCYTGRQSLERARAAGVRRTERPAEHIPGLRRDGLVFSLTQGECHAVRCPCAPWVAADWRMGPRAFCCVARGRRAGMLASRVRAQRGAAT